MVSICVLAATHSHTNKHTHTSALFNTKSQMSSWGTKNKHNLNLCLSTSHHCFFFPPRIRFPSIKDNGTASQKNQGKVFKQDQFMAPRRLLCHSIEGESFECNAAARMSHWSGCCCSFLTWTWEINRVEQGGECGQPNKCQTEGVLIVCVCVCACVQISAILKNLNSFLWTFIILRVTEQCKEYFCASSFFSLPVVTFM